MKTKIAGLALTLALGGSLASAATSQTTTAVMPVSATVANVCTYASSDSNLTTSPPVTPPPVGTPYNMTDVNGKTYTQANTDLGVYKANASSNSVTRNLYVHRCTSFTSFTPNAMSGVVTLKSAAKDNASSAEKTLNANWTLDTNGSVNDVPGVGDVHVGNVTFTIPAGQWNAAAGKYSGSLSVVINYQ